ncbi:hypothetical protein A3H26_00140 [candidate division WWE3 bacterium RIFCSPLOWO2_12_FULL_36_10]|uniref:Antitoxin n=1 Tax=candidate division WWE3 bacterium RIFCSPLOWO2_12_FULL_36_10 TaxID=1802630 RepID=A0A1F4VIS1_UNCKA|nr:MAG: hypothetical protein A3H26_00140 [candidate division WWE3 bacterium RIFCSPLOWO2_12_FULL_36_10]
MKKQRRDPFEGLVLDTYEQEVEDSVPAEDVFKVSKGDMERFAEIARAHKLFQVSKRINIRINNKDLAKVKAKARHNSIPYQTLISSIVHKYANGELEVTL